MKVLSILLAMLLATPLAAAQVLLITDTGHYLIKDGAAPTIIKVTKVVDLRVAGGGRAPDAPSPPKESPPKRQTLADRVRQAASEIGEPEVAEGLAVAYEAVIGQIKRGSGITLAKFRDVQKFANGAIIRLSPKRQQWRALLDMTWSEIAAAQNRGQILSAKDLVPILEEIARGLKGSANATWQVDSSGAQPMVIGEAGNVDRERLLEIVRFVLEIILKSFG